MSITIFKQFFIEKKDKIYFQFELGSKKYTELFQDLFNKCSATLQNHNTKTMKNQKTLVKYQVPSWYISPSIKQKIPTQYPLLKKFIDVECNRCNNCVFPSIDTFHCISSKIAHESSSNSTKILNQVKSWRTKKELISNNSKNFKHKRQKRKLKINKHQVRLGQCWNSSSENRRGTK